MAQGFIRYALLGVLAAGSLLADFSYEQTTKVTGGMMAGMMKFAGAFSKQVREPVRATVAVKGDRLVHLSPEHAQIIDLGKETITSIDFQKKSYSVMTFAEMQQYLDEMSQKMKQSKDVDIHFKVSVNTTGQSRQIAGFEAKEMILKMEMEGADKQSGQQGSMIITTEMWLAPRAAGYDEVRNFYKRMGQKLAWMPGGNMMMGRPDIAKGMAEVYKEASKLDGIPVYQVVKMGFAGQAPGQVPAASGAGAPPPPPPQTQEEKPSAAGAAGGALGGAVAGRMGRLGGLAGLGGLGRRRKQPKSEEQAPPPPPPAAQPAESAPSGPVEVSGSLMEMTSELTGFTTAPVDASKFEVPAGFKKVEPDMKRGR